MRLIDPFPMFRIPSRVAYQYYRPLYTHSGQETCGYPGYWTLNLRVTALAVSPRQLVNDGRPFMTPLHRTFPLKQWTDALTSVKCYKLGTDTFSYN